MTIKPLLAPTPQSTPASLALLILRLVVGVAFVLHGWGKIQNPTGWLPPGGPMNIPPALQLCAALAEFGGGIAIALGLLTRPAALALAITMAVATYFHAVVLKDPFVANTLRPTYEPALGYLAVSLVLLTVGPGRLSADALLFGRRR